MKKTLLLIALLIGAVAAKAATVEDICGEYNVDSFTGYESYWWHSTTDWQAFEYGDYTVTIEPLEADTVVLVGLFGPDLIGVYDAENSCINFPCQDAYGTGMYYFCKETLTDAGAFTISDEPVVATIDAKGNIQFDGWTILYDYQTGSYFSYFSGVKCSLSPLGSGTVSGVEKICGEYNVDSFTGYESYWWHSTTDWQEFDYGDYTVTIEPLEADTVVLVGLFGPDLIGVYDAENSCINFPCQDAYGTGMYYFCKETLTDAGAFTISDEPVVATIDAKGNIQFDGWTILYDYKTGSYYTYFSGVKCQLSPLTNSIKDIYTEEDGAEGPVYYYNINGVRINENALTPGLYIMRQGKSARKVIIK